MAEKMTLEQLVAMGLTEEQANEILGANTGGGSGSYPYPLLKLSYDTDEAPLGNFIFDVEKDKDGNIVKCTDLGKTVDMIICGSKVQYVKFNPQTGKPVLTSNLVDVAATAVDMKSGKLIKPMKDADPLIKYNDVMVVLVRPSGSTDDFIPAMFFGKGAHLYSFNQLRNGHPNVTSMLTLTNLKKKKGTVTYFELNSDKSSVVDLDTADVMSNIKTVAEVTGKFNQWVKAYNSSATAGGTTASNTTSSPEDEQDDGEEINFSA